MAYTNLGGYYQTTPPQQNSGVGGVLGGAAGSYSAKNGLMDQSQAAGQFGGQAVQGYGQLTGEAGDLRDYYRRLLAGQDSVAAEQLRQGVQQNVAAQRSMAAGAAPQNAAMAARTAAIQTGRIGSGMSGQAALAGIAERNAAASGLGNMLLTQRGQDVNAALGSQGNAIQGYGAVYGKPKDPAWWERGLSAVGGLGGIAALSDKRAKTDIEDGDKDATRLLEGLKAYTYRYKDEKNGKGRRVGIMAQDVERVAPHAVIDTPEGKQVHGAHLATALAAALPGMHARLKKLEGKR